jgi:hypothetical protein
MVNGGPSLFKWVGLYRLRTCSTSSIRPEVWPYKVGSVPVLRIRLKRRRSSFTWKVGSSPNNFAIAAPAEPKGWLCLPAMNLSYLTHQNNLEVDLENEFLSLKIFGIFIGKVILKV